MTFFNTKEEVIDIELTPYGKHLLSQGEWKPFYYEFHDDDILYDSEYAGITEKQDETKERIKNSLRKKSQYSFEGAETRYKRFLKRIKDGDGKNVPVLEQRKNFALSSLPLGTSGPASQSFPSVNVNVLNGEISSVVQEQIELIDSTNPIKVKGLPSSLYQIYMENQNYSLSFRAKTDNEAEQQIEESEIIIETFDLEEEQVQVKRENNYLLLDISETNVNIAKENFEILLYEIKEDEKTGEIVEFPLVFQKEKENVINNIYIDPAEMPNDDLEINKEYAEYYFDIMVDKEIPNDILCKHLTLEQIEKLNTIEGYGIVCEEKRMLKIDNNDLFVSSEQAKKLEDC